MTSTLQQGTKFSDAFWDNQYKGIEIVTSRLRKSRDTCEEIKKLYELRATIEQDYGERLLKLAQSSRIGEFEENSFAETLSRIPSTLETTARAHIDLAQQLKDHLEAPLDGFLKDQKEIRRVQQQQIENAKQRKTIHESDVARAKEDYVNECQKLQSLEQRLHDTMQGSVDDMTKIEKEIEEQKRTVIVADQVYKRSVDHYNTVNEKFIRDWTASADKFQEMEAKRISYLRSTLWSFANMMTSTFSIDEECCDRIRTALEITDVDKDMTSFVQRYGTGTQLPPPLVYTPICDPASLLPALSILPSTSTSFIEKQQIDHDAPPPSVTTILTNHDEELKSVDRQLQKLEVQSISETIPDQPASAQSNDKAFREIEQILDNHEPEKTQQTVPPIMMVNRLDEPQPKLDDFSSKVYNALGMKEDQVLEQHQSDLAPISSDPTNEHYSMMGSPDGIKPNKYKPMPNPTYQPSEQHETVPVIGTRTSSLSYHEKKLQNDEDEDDVEEREYQNRMPRLPPKDEKWVISSIRRPQQLPVKTLNATMFDGSIRNSVPVPSVVSSPVPEELELKHQPKLHKPVVPLTIDIPNSVKPVVASEPPQQAAQQVIQEGRKQSHISPVQHDHFNQQPPSQQQNGVSEENGMGIRPAPWQENFQTDDHVIKNAGYRGTPMMATAANAAVPATAYYSYQQQQQQQQQQQRGSVFKQDPYAFEEEPKKRFGIKSHAPVSNTKQQNESTLKSASAKEKEKGRFSLGFFGGNKKEKKKEKEANSNATIIANYQQQQQQQQSRPISQTMYAPSYESNENKSHYSGNQPNGTSQPITENRFICYAKAQWPFEATIEGEMSFHQEEVLGVLRKQTDGWWEAERIGNVNTGQRGLVPGNYMIDNYPAP